MITARVSRKRLLLFFSTDALKVAVLVIAAATFQNWIVALGAALLTAVLAYFAHLRLKDVGIDGELSVGDEDVVLSSGHRLPLDAIKSARVEVWRAQKLLVIEGFADDAVLFLPDIYDSPAEALAAAILRQARLRSANKG